MPWSDSMDMRENEEDVDHADKFCILYCAYNAIAGVK